MQNETRYLLTIKGRNWKTPCTILSVLPIQTISLTCTDQNFMSKSCRHQDTSEHVLVVIAQDTSHCCCNIKEEDESLDFGTSAGFYVSATKDPWKTN